MMTGMSADPGLLNARSLPRLAGAIRALRRARGLSQGGLAQRAGVSRQWVNAVEQGRTDGLEIGRLMRVLDALDASLTIRDDLVGVEHD
jgi:HTH-type transcriptional regulator / antitoxin HipB